MITESRHRLIGRPPEGLSAQLEREVPEPGVPAQATLDRWVGPTLFSSELGAGKLVPLGQRWPSQAGHPLGSHWVIASIRDPRSAEAAVPYAAFVLEPGSGRLRLVDLDEPGRERFVNSSLGAFLRALAAFVAWWESAARVSRSGPEPSGRWEQQVNALGEELAAIDPDCLAFPENYWPLWCEDLRQL